MTTVGRIDIEHSDSSALCFVVDHGLKFSKCPSVQTRANLLACFDARPDVGQVFQDDDSCFLLLRFLYNIFGDVVVNMLHTAGFFARDLLQKLSRRLSTVGLQPLPFYKKFSAFLAYLASAIEFYAASHSKNIYPQVYTQDFCFGRYGNIGKLENEVEVPSAFAAIPKEFPN